MKIQILIDNRKLDNTLLTEHGLCVYVETETHKCLLDVGASDKFIQNATQLNIDIAAIDYVFISHGHADHIGGLTDFLKINSKAKIVLSKNALTQHFYSNRNGLKDISSGFDQKLINNRFVFIDSKMTFEDDIHVFPSTKGSYPTPKANKTLLKKSDENLISDDFNHEIIVCFGKNRMVVYSGCAHCGVLNIMETVTNTLQKPISTLIGGFHLIDGIDGQYETEDEINTLADEILLQYPETYFLTGHCTGEKVYLLLKEKLKEKLSRFYTGFSTSLPNN